MEGAEVTQIKSSTCTRMHSQYMYVQVMNTYMNIHAYSPEASLVRVWLCQVGGW